MTVAALLSQIANSSSLNAKKELLKTGDSGLLRQVLLYALDPFRTFGIAATTMPAIDPAKCRGSMDLSSHHPWVVLDDLAARNLTGSTAISAVKNLFALLDLESAELIQKIILKDLRAGFGITMTNQVFKDLIPVFDVMLAKPLDDIDDLVFPVAGEIKYDGLRAAAFVDPAGGTVTFYSRNGKTFNSVPHLEKALLEFKATPGPHWFDGELITTSFNDSSGDIRRKSKTADNATFFIFEFLHPFEFSGKRPAPPYAARRERLESLFKTSMHTAGLSISGSRPITNQEELLAMRDEVWAAGGEGLIVKTLNGGYENKRSKHWLKIKKCETLDLPIIGSLEGEGKYVGQLGKFVVDCSTVEVKVGSGISDAQRRVLWQDRPALIGRIIEVEYHEKTPDGSLRHPRFVRFREDKDAA
jgi:DNA ligase-1